MIDCDWDNDKASETWRKHGVTFHQAGAALRDPFAIERIDDRKNYDEERVNALGMCEGVLLHVTYTERDGSHPDHFSPTGDAT